MKCHYCFTDAFDQKCNRCGVAACNNHVDDNGICPAAHGLKIIPSTEVPPADDTKEEETPEEPPQPKPKSRTKPEA